MIFGMKWQLIYRAELKSHHLKPGRTKHTLVQNGVATPFPPFKKLDIVASDDGFYLLYYPDTGHGTDTFHLTVDDAMHQAEYEFAISPDEWERVSESHAGS